MDEEERREGLENADKITRRRVSVHDVYFHAMLDNRPFVARYLNAYLPESVRAVLDLSDPSKIEILSTEFYDERLKKHVADLIFLVPFKDSSARAALRLIAEHKAQSGASVDRRTIAQTLKYLTLEVDARLRELKGDSGVFYQPLVVVFYTGSDPDFEVPSWESCFPLPELLQIEELRESQVRFKPLCVNLTRMFLADELNKEDFLYVMNASMSLASLKRLPESYSTLFNALGQIENWTDEDRLRLKTSINYVVAATDRPMTREDMETLRQGVNSEEARENMKTILDLIRDEGRDEGLYEGEIKGEIKGKIKGKIETIETVASLRFQEKPERLTSLLTKLNDLNLLEQIRQFAMASASLFDVERFAESMLQFKFNLQGSVKEQTL